MLSRILDIRTLVLTLAALVGLCHLPDVAAAKSYRMADVVIGAQLLPDGIMDVTETRTYEFEGSFTFAYRDLPLGGAVTFGDFGVSEGDRQYTLSRSKAPGTYSIMEGSGRTRVTWYYSANDESRTFTFHYSARNAIERYEDAAVLYFKFLSEDWDQPQDNIRLRLKPPVTLSKDQVKAWLHGPLWAGVQIIQDGTIFAGCRHLPRHTYLEIRALYPPEVFPETPSRTGAVRKSIMAEEAKWANEANRTRRVAREKHEARQDRTRLGRWAMIGTSLAGLAVWWTIFRKYHRKPALPRFLDMTSEIPEKTPPALLSYLLYSRQVSGAALVGTMLDLAQRGFLELREQREQVKRFWGGMKDETKYYWDLKRDHWDQHAPDMLDYENELLAFIFSDLAQGADSISMDEIKKKRSAFMKFFRKWKKSVEEVGKKKEWFDTTSIRGMYLSLAVAGPMLGLTILGMFLIGPWALILAGATIAIIILSFFIPHRTAEGETKARHWKAVQKYLKKYEFRTADRTAVLSQISAYLIYGVVLGFSTKFYKELATYIPETAHRTYVPWYVYAGHGTGDFSPAAFGEAFSSMVATTTSAMSSAAGTGGGASAGGGGGAGSGGGGAG